MTFLKGNRKWFKRAKCGVKIISISRPFRNTSRLWVRCQIGNRRAVQEVRVLEVFVVHRCKTTLLIRRHQNWSSSKIKHHRSNTEQAHNWITSMTKMNTIKWMKLTLAARSTVIDLRRQKTLLKEQKILIKLTINSSKSSTRRRERTCSSHKRTWCITSTEKKTSWASTLKRGKENTQNKKEESKKRSG